MARTRERLAVARRALGTLQTLLAQDNPSDVVRDAAIQRFEYSFEAAWKAAQAYLLEVEGTDVASPRAAIRDSYKVGRLGEDDTRAALSMVDDRNLTVHTYNEALAKAIFARLGAHARVLAAWLEALDEGATLEEA